MISFSLASFGRRASSQNSVIAVVQPGATAIRTITEAFDENPQLVAWTTRGIYFAASQRTWAYLYHVDPDSKELTRHRVGDEWKIGDPRELWLGAGVVTSLSRRAVQLAIGCALLVAGDELRRDIDSFLRHKSDTDPTGHQAETIPNAHISLESPPTQVTEQIPADPRIGGRAAVISEVAPPAGDPQQMERMLEVQAIIARWPRRRSRCVLIRTPPRLWQTAASSSTSPANRFRVRQTSIAPCKMCLITTMRLFHAVSKRSSPLSNRL